MSDAWMYSKLFLSLLDSSVWNNEPDHVLRVFLAMVLLADPHDGFVRGVESAIVARAKVSPKLGRDAIQRLEAPDLESQSQEYGGARIVKVEGGWIVVNKPKYQALRTARQKKDAERQQRKRLKDKAIAPTADAADRVTSRDVTPDISASPSLLREESAREGADAPVDPLASIASTPERLRNLTLLRRAHRYPAEFDRALEELLTLGWAPEAIGDGIVELVRTGARFSPDTLLTFVERVATRGPRPTPPRPAVVVIGAPPPPAADFCDECHGELVPRDGQRRLQMAHKPTCSRWRAA
jgi:hypothetical protein